MSNIRYGVFQNSNYHILLPHLSESYTPHLTILQNCQLLRVIGKQTINRWCKRLKNNLSLALFNAGQQTSTAVTSFSGSPRRRWPNSRARLRLTMMAMRPWMPNWTSLAGLVTNSINSLSLFCHYRHNFKSVSVVEGSCQLKQLFKGLQENHDFFRKIIRSNKNKKIRIKLR